MRQMHVVVLAAGKGSRLNTWNQNLPKLFLEINGKTTFEYQLDALTPLVKQNLVDSMITTVLGYGFDSDEKFNDRVQEYVKVRPEFTYNPVYLPDWDDVENAATALQATDCLEVNDHILLLCGDVITAPTQMESVVSTFVDEHAPDGFSSVVAYEGYQDEMTSVRWNNDRIVTDYGAIEGHQEAGIFILHEDHIEEARSIWKKSRESAWFPVVFPEIPTKAIRIDEEKHVEINTDDHFNHATNVLPFEHYS